MTFFDLIITLLVLMAAIRGWRNGLFVEIASLVSFIIGIYIAVKFSGFVANALGDSVSSSVKTTKVVAFIVVLVVVVIGIHLLAKVFSGIASFVFLGWLNKLGGVVLAVIKTLLLLGVVFGLFQKVNPNGLLVSKETQEKSFYFKPVLELSEVLLPVVSDWFKEIHKTVDGKPETESNTTSTAA